VRRIFLVARVICGIVGASVALVIVPMFLIYVCRGFPQLFFGIAIDCLIIAGFIWLIISGVNSALSDRADHDAQRSGE
jgi:small neutral amino acid transporter SnatA (MarC family)